MQISSHRHKLFLQRKNLFCGRCFLQFRILFVKFFLCACFYRRINLFSFFLRRIDTDFFPLLINDLPFCRRHIPFFCIFYLLLFAGFDLYFIIYRFLSIQVFSCKNRVGELKLFLFTVGVFFVYPPDGVGEFLYSSLIYQFISVFVCKLLGFFVIIIVYGCFPFYRFVQ